MPAAPLVRRLRRILPATVAALTLAALAFGVASAASAGTLLGDDFSDGDASGWSRSGGTWTVVSDGSQVLRQSNAGVDNARVFTGSSSWSNYAVQARVKPLTFGASGSVGLLARASGSTTFYRLALLPGNQVQLQSIKSGQVTVLGGIARTVSAGVWYTLAIEASGATIRGSIDGTQVASATSTAIATGRVGLQTQFSTAEFDDVVVSSGGVTPSPSASASASASTSPSTSPSASPSRSPTTSPSVSPSGPTPTGDTLVVAKDGSGDYSTVQAAVNAVPTGNSRRITIRIKPGTYREMVSIPSSKPYLSFVGATGNAADVVITYDNASGTTKPGGGAYGTSGSASVTIDGHDFIAQAVTFANSFDEASSSLSDKQAVAVLTRADRLIFDNVRFLGNQDTLYHNSASSDVIGRAYFRNCYVEGDVDFIFGRGTGVFDHCQIHSLSRGSSSNNGYVTAASTMISNPYGLLFTECTLTSNAPAKSVHLGRPWHPSKDPNAIAQVVYRDTTLGAHIKDSPWTDMSGFSWKEARFFEYHNTGPGSTVTADRPQLTDAQAATYTPQKYLAGADGWNPIP